MVCGIRGKVIEIGTSFYVACTVTTNVRFVQRQDSRDIRTNDADVSPYPLRFIWTTKRFCYVNFPDNNDGKPLAAFTVVPL